MQTSLTHKRKQGTVLLACLYLLFVLFILGVFWAITVKICRHPPCPPGHGWNTNDMTDIDMTMSGGSSRFDRAYRLVLQRTTNGTDWVDLGGVDWNGGSVNLSVTTNWTDMALFRVKANQSRP